MTRDDIEAFFKSINFSTDDEDSFQIFWDFAKVVAAAERKRIIAANAPEIEKLNVYIKTLEDAVAIRERGQA